MPTRLIALLLSFLSLSTCAATIGIGDTIRVTEEEWDAFAAQMGLVDTLSTADDTTALDTAATETDTTALDDCERAIVGRVEKLLTHSFTRRAQVGVYIYDLTDDKPIFMHNEAYMLRPASNEKVITAITALSLLGTDYTYKTSLFIDGEVVNDTLRGNVYIKAGYDPRFDRDDMAAFIHALTGQGIRAISGDIVFDISMKDTLQLGWGWCWDDEESNLSPLKYSGSGNFKEAMVKMMMSNDMLLYGSFRFGRISRSAREIVVRSHSIDQVLGRMMKKSDNMYAESMFYQIAAKSGVAYADRSYAVKYINQLVRRVGLDPQNYKFADGSGLSLYNYASAELLVRLLRYAYQHNDIYDVLKPSLPIAGVDGTLRNRMKSGSAHNAVFAKTGTVKGVSTLSGYTRAANGHVLCFSIMTQGVRNSTEARNWQDRICQAMTE